MVLEAQNERAHASGALNPCEPITHSNRNRQLQRPLVFLDLLRVSSRSDLFKPSFEPHRLPEQNSLVQRSNNKTHFKSTFPGLTPQLNRRRILDPRSGGRASETRLRRAGRYRWARLGTRRGTLALHPCRDSSARSSRPDRSRASAAAVRRASSPPSSGRPREICVRRARALALAQSFCETHARSGVAR